ncbi:hypothetical protein [Magnetovibrio sp.]|uniref:hypothetical protein n=1 Tax=Magnetovibrio sp. TaxID=2024836 RepID=UPI002F95ACFB
MNSMNAESFEDLAQQCVMSRSKHRMLYVFVRVGAVDGADEEATMVQVLFDAHQPAAHGMTFSSVRDTADAHNADWNMVIVGIAENSDASMPSEEQAQTLLADMREKIMIGAIEGYALFDRDGKSVEVEAEVVPITANMTIN